MSAVDYPDLTRAAVGSLAELLPRARADMTPVLDRARTRPLPASPASRGTEPADSPHLLAGLPVPDPAVVAPAPAPADRPPHLLGVLDLLDAFAHGTITPSQLLAHLRRRWADSALTGGAILAVVGGADEAAATADLRWRAGTPRPLEGIPFAVKDIIDVAATPVTAGSLTTGDRIAAADATVVARLRAAGAIPVLIAATTEFACGAPRNARYGTVTNPWDRDRWTGGSSTGSAGALAAGLVPLALGSDTGGSIRVPSAFCNLTGIKPTYGLVPRTGVASLSWTLDHVGPMARSAADLRTVLAVLAGPDGSDPCTAPAPVAAALGRHLTTGATPGPARLDGVTVGIPGSWFTDLCDGGVLAAWQATVETVRALGARVVALDIPDIAAIDDAFLVVLTSELAANQEAALADFARFDIGTQVRIARGTVPSAVDYLRALRLRAPAQRAALAAFDTAGADVLLTPGIGATAPRLSDATVDIDGARYPMQSIIGRNTAVFDYLGFPAVMLPAGSSGGLPVGAQLAGRPWADDLCLRVAAAVQSVTSHHERHADV
ncbi:amidase [Nocardia higoensis]|uniref:amidase n=1 Tax=Nocardia higoensis TaxID=228599 RepID=UPI0002F6749C|nr:amidase [Nocardia higoensis]